MQLELVSCLITVFTYGWNQAELYEWNYYAESDDVHASETASEHTQYIKAEVCKSQLNTALRNTYLCWIWGSHSGDYEKYGILCSSETDWRFRGTCRIHLQGGSVCQSNKPEEEDDKLSSKALQPRKHECTQKFESPVWRYIRTEVGSEQQ
jgi:hypothetical protein